MKLNFGYDLICPTVFALDEAYSNSGQNWKLAFENMGASVGKGCRFATHEVALLEQRSLFGGEYAMDFVRAAVKNDYITVYTLPLDAAIYEVPEMSRTTYQSVVGFYAIQQGLPSSTVIGLLPSNQEQSELLAAGFSCENIVVA